MNERMNAFCEMPSNGDSLVMSSRHSISSTCLDQLFVEALNTVLPDSTLLMSAAGNQTDLGSNPGFTIFSL